MVFNVDGEEYYKDVKINKTSTKKIIESAKKEVATEESTTESSSTVEAELPDKIDFDPEKVKSFESVSGSMADRFNTEVFKAIKTVKLDTEKQMINVTLFNSVESMDQDKKVTVARELGVVPEVLRKSGLARCRVGFSRLTAWCHRAGTCPGSGAWTIGWR